MEYDEFHAMNTTVLVAAEGHRKALKPGFDCVRHLVAASEQRFSRFRATSELAFLNRAAGKPFEVSEEMFSLLEAAVDLHHRTEGLFDPAVLGALEAAGYDRSMDEIRRAGCSPVAPGGPAPSPGFDRVELDLERRQVWMPPGMQIDLGGIAKGWIAGRAAYQMAEYTSAVAVSVGGDMVLFGLPQGEMSWQISLEDPRDANQVLAVLSAGPGSVATSSVTRRRWQQGGRINHHIIDPRLGLPARSPWLSVTVLTQQATDAEAYAKALLIGGPDRAWDLARRAGSLHFIAVQPDGSLIGNWQPTEITYVPESVG